MKNLIVETQQTNFFKDDFILHEIYYCCYDCDNNRYYCLDANENRLIAVDIINNKKYIDQLLTFNKQEKLIAIEYCSVNEEIYIACDSGLVFSVTPENDFSVKCDEIADFSNGILSMKISPDHEIVVLLTKDLTVVTMNSNFEVLKEENLKANQFGEKQFITVGWGKKETQFHGSEGKAAAKAKAVLTEKTDTDNGLPKITWKGDGSMFAVSYIDDKVNARRFKVFDREGILQYTSELVDCLEGTLSWKPSGNLIAASRKLPNKHTVSFFEKNGLLHRELILNLTTRNILIQDLIWSRDSDILGVLYKNLDTNVTTLLLYYEKNYHWYLKQTIVYPKENPILFITWSFQTDKDLLILTSRGTSIYRFSWNISHSQGKKTSDKAVVGVIDGDKVLVTCFKDSIVPPPMAQQTLQFKKNVNAISFAPKCVDNTDINPNDFLVLLNDNKIVHCVHTNESWSKQYNLEKTYNINLQLKNVSKYSTHLLQHFFWYKPKIILCSLPLGEKSALCEINLLEIDVLNEILVDVKLIQEIPNEIEHIIPSVDSNTAYIVVKNQLYSYNNQDGLKKSPLKIADESLSRAVIKIESTKFENKEVVIALTRKYVLYVNGKQVSNNVNSFIVNSDFLLLTTLQHTLISFRLNQDGYNQLCTKDLTIQPWKSETNELQINPEISIRRIERSSALVTSIQKDSKVILQMPRGNLECIQPRALALDILGTYIDELNYSKAFDLMRKQRIDLNLFYDHNPSLFLSNISKFVDDINNSTWLSLFLSDLKSEDVTRTMYLSSYGKRQEQENSLDKIEVICKTLRSIMEEKDSKYFIQPILISLVKNKKTNGIEDALRRIKKLMTTCLTEQDEENSDAEKNSSTEENSDAENIEYTVKNFEDENREAKEALKYLLYMVDVNVLYDIALGMYDFDLVLLVAEKSQKDPKEYYAFLNEFYVLEENYRKFKIDCYLKRYDSALKHIVNLPDKFEECLDFVQKHGLYSAAIKLFKCNSKEYKILSDAYGKYLMDKNKFKEAGIMFIKGGNLKEALNSFKLGLEWRDASVVAIKLNLSKMEINELYQDLVEKLVEDKRFGEAAKILAEKLNQFEDAVATLCKGRLWHQAWTDANCMKREDLIETHVKPGLIDYAEFSITQLRQHKQDFEKYKNRLKIVRELAIIREEAARTQLAADSDEENSGAANQGLSDLISETTSIAGSTTTRTSQSSRTSGRTYKSSKNRRKHERKLQSIKEGSVYEDLALIRMLHQLASQAYNQREEIRSMAEMLLYIDNDKLAAELYELMTEFLNEIRQSKQSIWPVNKVSVEELNVDSIISHHRDIPPNLIEPQLLQPPEEKSCDWKLDLFSVL